MKKKFKRFRFNFWLLERFSVDQDEFFCCFQLGKVVFASYAYIFGFFLAQKLVNKCPFAYLNKTGKSKVGAISKAQKAQTF